MNIDHAKRIPMSDLLAKLDHHAKRVTGDKALYLSPLRKEKTPSFWVYYKENRWYDYGEPTGGDVIDFVCRYLKNCREDHTIADALRWIGNMIGNDFIPSDIPQDVYSEQETEPVLFLKSKCPIQHLALIRYLDQRCIALPLARKHLCQVRVQNTVTAKSFFALGFRNEEGGYELRNPFFKGSLKPKTISFIRGEHPKPERIHLFEGFMDYLSAIQHSDIHLDGDSIVLNSIACLPKAFPYIRNYGYRLGCTWLDNDRAGESASRTLSEFLRNQPDLQHIRMNGVYAAHKDVNAWHMAKRNLSAGLRVS